MRENFLTIPDRKSSCCRKSLQKVKIDLVKNRTHLPSEYAVAKTHVAAPVAVLRKLALLLSCDYCPHNIRSDLLVAAGPPTEFSETSGGFAHVERCAWMWKAIVFNKNSERHTRSRWNGIFCAVNSPGVLRKTHHDNAIDLHVFE